MGKVFAPLVGSILTVHTFCSIQKANPAALECVLKVAKIVKLSTETVLNAVKLRSNLLAEDLLAAEVEWAVY